MDCIILTHRIECIGTLKFKEKSSMSIGMRKLIVGQCCVIGASYKICNIIYNKSRPLDLTPNHNAEERQFRRIVLSRPRVLSQKDIFYQRKNINRDRSCCSCVNNFVTTWIGNAQRRKETSLFIKLTN